jgi:hypothetical protein
MEQLRNDGGAVRSPGRLDNLERARQYFERKAGMPVSSAEAREWLDSLVDFLRTAQRWAADEAAHRASTACQPDIQPLARDSSRDTQALPPAPVSRRIAAHRKPRASGRDSTRNTRDVPRDARTERTASTGQE